MIRKRADAEIKPRGRRERLRKGDPLEVELTVSFRFGDEAGDQVTPIRERKVPMVDSVFKNRDRIIRGFVKLLVKTGLTSPQVVGHLLPLGARRRPRR
ncbi:hypothetical protein AAG565_02715 [Fontimonas sp. SYSU GA230001]|uniref:hypothetical protein n=1 Tax=Fontimonas sp. SYSU GA230001 TaxID=3142450 RepID=UPI0032B5001E